MKKLILSALIMGSAAVAANAQANSVLLFGNIGFHSVTDDADNKTRDFNITPGIGYQFDNHWTLGVYGSFGTHRTITTTQTDWTYQNSYGVGGFARYTCPVGKIFAFYSQLEAGYFGYTYGVSGVANSGGNAGGFRAALTPAVAVYVMDGFALNFSYGGLQYNHINSTNTFDLNWGNQVNFGISKNIFCGKGKHRHHGMKMNHGSQVEKEDMNDSED
jgi:hypothetical protein